MNINVKVKSLFLFSILFFVFGITQTFADQNIKETNERKKVRVGYFIGEGFQELSPVDGHRSGYCYEYLQTLSYYTGWEYEYVETTWADALEKIAVGEIDILAQVSRTSEREKNMLYAKHPMGAEEYYFYILPGSKKFRANDLSTLNGARVGVNASSYQLYTFIDWCKENNVHCNIIESVDENYRKDCLYNGEIDAIVDNDFYLDQGWTPLFKTGKSDYYMCVTPSRKDIYDELNEAQEKLFEDTPLYIEKLQSIYFPHDVIMKNLNTRESEWVEAYCEKNGHIKFGYIDNYLPYCTQNDETGKLEGVITVFIDNLKRVFEVDIETIAFKDYNELYDAVRTDKIDACFPLYNNIWQSEKLGIMQTDSIIDVPVAYISQKNKYNISGLETFAAAEKRQTQIAYIHDKHPGANIVFYDNFEKCVEAVSKGEADGFYINSFMLSQFYDAYQEYSNLDVVYMKNNASLSIGVKYPYVELLTIFNKAVSLVDDAIETSVLVQNSQIEQTYSVKKFLRDHVIATVIFISIVSLLIVFIFWMQLTQVRMAQKQTEIAKQKAEEVNINLSVALAREKETQNAVHEAFKAASKANNAKSEFLASMSHDIRTPMNSIVGMAAIATANIDDAEKIKHCLSEITISSKHLLGIINEVLDMNKIESGKLDLSESSFNLANLVDEFMLLAIPLAQTKSHKFIVNTHGIKHENLIGDANRIQQILMNFMSNAVKYTPEGGTIKFTITERITNRPQFACYEFMFEDNGIGMSEDFVKVIFEPFSRADDERAVKQQGTGLGMSISRNIVKMMNGDIKVESEINKGTRITATVFLELQDIDKKIDYSSFINLPVLVVDDDEETCESICVMLNEFGMTSEYVQNGKEAVEKVFENHNNNYFAVIVDWDNEGGKGTALAIREKVGKDVPIIIASEYDRNDILSDAVAVAVNGFISKPIFKSKIAEAFIKVTEKNEFMEPEEELESLEKFREEKFEGATVLLVEDNKINAEIEKEILATTGLKVEHVWNGKSAVDKITKSADYYYKLIFMDLHMPLMDGFEATQIIRNSDRKYLQKIPIIAMSANAFLEDIRKSISSGMSDHIAKPINFDQLLEILNKWIKK